MRILLLLALLPTVTLACEPDCQVGVTTGIAACFYAQYANILGDIYTSLATALPNSTALPILKTTLTTVATTPEQKILPAVRTAIFQKYSGNCVDVGVLCGNPVAVYYGMEDALTLAQNAANSVIAPVVNGLSEKLNADVAAAGVDAATVLNVAHAVNTSMPAGGIVLKYEPAWVPVVQATLAQWP